MAPRQRSPNRLPPSYEDVVDPMSSVASSPLVYDQTPTSKLEDDAVVGSTAKEVPDCHQQRQRRQRAHCVGRSREGCIKTSKGCDRKSLSVQERDRHDIFNLVALPSVIFLTAANYDWEKVLLGMGPELSWTDAFFGAYWLVTMCYFLVDLIWVKLVPTSVKSPHVIINHHIVAMIYLVAPIYLPEFRWCMGACLSVELNTWFLIARRVAYLRRDVVPAVLSDLITVMFYMSWIAIRCVLYPYIMAVYVQKAQAALIETGTLMHWPIIFVPVHFSLCLLNLKWSFDLFYPMLCRWFQREGGKAGGVSDGL